MPETEMILLVAAVLLLCLLVWEAGRIRSRLARIEARMAEFQNTSAATHGDDAADTEPSPGGLFESFLAEDPARRDLPKNEQFAAFRKWRKDKGLSWSGS